MLSTGSGSTMRRRRCLSFTRWSNGVGPPVVRTVRTANTLRDCTREATRARDSSSSWSPSSMSRSSRAAPACSRSAAAARWNTAPRSRSSGPAGAATSTGSKCDSAANGIDRPSGCPLARALGMPAASARSRTFSASRVLPTPAPPVRSTPPAAWPRNHSASTSSSLPRPTIGHAEASDRSTIPSGASPSGSCAMPCRGGVVTNRRDEPVAAPVHGLDHALVRTVVPDGTSCRLDASRQS